MSARACLRPGGRLVLEPQPWSSYRKRSKLTPTIARHFAQICMRPAQFEEYLTSEAGGFATCEQLDVKYAADVARNFKSRPLLVLTKRR